MVLGETEITAKSKTLRDRSQRGLTGRVLNRLFQRHSGDKRNSDAHRDRARHGFNQKHSSGIDWKDRSVAAIDHGPRAGEMAENCVRLLVKKGGNQFSFSNRSFDRALDLATRCGGEAVCFGYCLFEMRMSMLSSRRRAARETLLGRRTT